MPRAFRSLARRLVAVERAPTYYLPWLTRPGLDCALVLNNVESRFKSGFNEGPFSIAITQYDADGSVVRRDTVQLAESLDVVELPLLSTPAGCGIVTVEGDRLLSDLYVTLSNGEYYTATHGRGEFVERYPWWARAVALAVGAVLAPAGRTLPAFARDQYLHVERESRSHVLLLNLSNVTNRVRVAERGDRGARRAALLTLAPMGASLLEVGRIAGAEAAVSHVRFEGNAWFNLYIVGAGPRDLAGPLSLMHVK
jgi:hypothetical protein